MNYAVKSCFANGKACYNILQDVNGKQKHDPLYMLETLCIKTFHNQTNNIIMLNNLLAFCCGIIFLDVLLEIWPLLGGMFYYILLSLPRIKNYLPLIVQDLHSFLHNMSFTIFILLNNFQICKNILVEAIIGMLGDFIVDAYAKYEFHDYRMIDGRFVVEQAHEICLLVKKLKIFCCTREKGN
ncbi:hypothetical protein ACJX0J_026416 [Zea mays]